VDVGADAGHMAKAYLGIIMACLDIIHVPGYSMLLSINHSVCHTDVVWVHLKPD